MDFDASSLSYILAMLLLFLMLTESEIITNNKNLQPNNSKFIIKQQ